MTIKPLLNSNTAADVPVLLLVIANWKWITFVFPLWMLLVSAYILFAESRSRRASTSEAKQFQI
jgi:uncharacterized protein (DUF58 family)